MTRKKWNRLRRQWPHLFAMLHETHTGWESWQHSYAKMGSKELIAKLSAKFLANGPAPIVKTPNA
jgi:hypothetical protein